MRQRNSLYMSHCVLEVINKRVGDNQIFYCKCNQISKCNQIRLSIELYLNKVFVVMHKFSSHLYLLRKLFIVKCCFLYFYLFCYGTDALT